MARGRRCLNGRRSWKKFERRDPEYYNQYFPRALAEGLVGKSAEAEASLVRRAKLSGKALDFSEFQKIRDLLKRFR